MYEGANVLQAYSRRCVSKRGRDGDAGIAGDALQGQRFGKWEVLVARGGCDLDRRSQIGRGSQWGQRAHDVPHVLGKRRVEIREAGWVTVEQQLLCRRRSEPERLARSLAERAERI